MPITLGLVANIYQEANALPGWLEAHLPHFDDVRIFHAGPRGELSTDGTMELLARWGVPVTVGSIDGGFGAVRTAAIRSSPCDYVMILDADERLFAATRHMVCRGRATPQSEVDRILRGYDFRGGKSPDWDALASLGSELRVDTGEVYDQVGYLHDLLAVCRPDVVCAVRRHWHDFSMRRPTQDWEENPDWQMRIVRNDPSIYFDPAQPMHERLVGYDPKRVAYPSDAAVYMDHFHFWFKRMEQPQRAHDVACYDAIHAGQLPPTWDEFRETM